MHNEPLRLMMDKQRPQNATLLTTCDHQGKCFESSLIKEPCKFMKIVNTRPYNLNHTGRPCNENTCRTDYLSVHIVYLSNSNFVCSNRQVLCVLVHKQRSIPRTVISNAVKQFFSSHLGRDESTLYSQVSTICTKVVMHLFCITYLGEVIYQYLHLMASFYSGHKPFSAKNNSNELNLFLTHVYHCTRCNNVF